jgi:transposase
MTSEELAQRLNRIEAILTDLVRERTSQDYYSTAQAAEILGKAEFTVREWCRNGRVHAEKRQTGRGCSKEWMISHSELRRIQSEGLLPPPDPFSRLRRDT